MLLLSSSCHVHFGSLEPHAHNTPGNSPLYQHKYLGHHFIESKNLTVYNAQFSLKESIVMGGRHANSTANTIESLVSKILKLSTTQSLPDNTEQLDALHGALVELLLKHKIKIIDTSLVADHIISLIQSSPIEASRRAIIADIIARLKLSGIQALAKILALITLISFTLYVVRLFYQLAIEATIGFGQLFNSQFMFENNAFHVLMGVCAVIASAAVYIRSGYITAIAEYHAVRTFIRQHKKISPMTYIARMVALAPAISMAILAYPSNGLLYSVALGLFLYALLAPSMKDLINLRPSQAMKVILLGAPALGYFIAPFALPLFSQPTLAVTSHYLLGIITAWAFAAFGGMGAITFYQQIQLDIDIAKQRRARKVPLLGKWLLATVIGLGSGLATSAVWLRLLQYYGLEGHFSLIIMMIFGLLAGVECNQPHLNHLLSHARAYSRHFFKTSFKQLAFLPENINRIFSNCDDQWLERLLARVSAKSFNQPPKNLSTEHTTD